MPPLALDWYQRRQARALHRRGWSYPRLARKFGVGVGSIAAACKGSVAEDLFVRRRGIKSPIWGGLSEVELDQAEALNRRWARVHKAVVSGPDSEVSLSDERVRRG